jgi:hypothetical protein
MTRDAHRSCMIYACEEAGLEVNPVTWKYKTMFLFHQFLGGGGHYRNIYTTDKPFERVKRLKHLGTKL